MKAGGQTAGVGVCLLLGVGDLVVLNTVLVPDYIQSQSTELTVVQTPRPTHVAKAPHAQQPPAPKAAAKLEAHAPTPVGAQAPAKVVAKAPTPEASEAVAQNTAPKQAPPPNQSPKALAAKAPVAAEPPAERAPASAKKAAPSSQSWLLRFGHNKYVLTRRAQRTLATVAKAAQPGLRVVVEGHSNDIGPSEYNRLLSRRRAETVVRWLTRHGVAKEVIVVRWHGEDRPKLVKKTRTARSLNRRVEVSVEEQ